MDNQIPEGYRVKKVTWKDVASEIADIFILAAIMGIGFLGLWLFLWG